MKRSPHKFGLCAACALAIGVLVAPTVQADLTPGLISDFNDGTLQGWNPPNGQASNVDNYLQIVSRPNMSVFTDQVAGAIDPSVTGVQFDLMRPAGQTDLEMRLVLRGSDHWTSTQPNVVPGDGVWRSYVFSTLEDDLTQVQGSGPFSNLTTNFNRLQLRYDPGSPNSFGQNAPGELGIDNVLVLSEQALSGDFNGDGVVDAADYTVWRDNPDGAFTPADYTVWSHNYGATRTVNAQSVPEPAAALLLLLTGCLAASQPRRR